MAEQQSPEMCGHCLVFGLVMMGNGDVKFVVIGEVSLEAEAKVMLSPVPLLMFEVGLMLFSPPGGAEPCLMEH